MPPRLVALAGPLQGQSFELEDEPLTLGRQASNRVRLRELSVSRRHCVLEPQDDGFLVRDLGTRHGTLVNQRPITQRLLADGDLLAIGDSVFCFQTEGSSADGQAPDVELAEGRFDDASTVHLSPQDALLSHQDRVLAALPAGARLPLALNALLAISRAVHGLEDAAELGRELLARLAAAVPAERGTLLLYEPDGELNAVAALPDSAARRFELSRTVIRQVLDSQTGLLSAEIPGDFAASDSLEAASVRSLLCVPLVHRQNLLGVLYLDSSKSDARFDRDHLELVTAAAAIAAAALDNARRLEWLERERRRLTDTELRHDLVGEGPAMTRVHQLIARIAPTDSTVLITGESGCGKELVARALHTASRRSERSFVAVNCATLSEPLLESELFGHERGAFTGATGRHQGKFELAEGGTLFLDEIGEIPIQLQAKLLRTLQEREIERLGGRRPIAVDVRVIAATNRDLKAEIERGGFRQDLYYRLNVLEIPLPPLRERREDVPLLLNHFLHLHSRTLKRPLPTLAPAARSALLQYDWPGNVRELANAVERALVLAQDDLVRPEDLPDALFESPLGDEPATDYHQALNDFKSRLVLDAVTEARGNMSRAAKSLGISRNYLYRLVKNLELGPRLPR